MVIKKFSAPTMRDAMYKVKQELGDDAIILKSEKVSKGGLFDFSETKYEYEITAAIDRAPIKTYTQKKQIKIPSQKEKTAVSASGSSNTNLMNQMDNKFKVIDLKSDLKKIESKLDGMAKHIKYNEMPNLPDSLIPYYIRMKESSVDENIIKDLLMNLYMNFKGSEFSDTKLIEKTLLELICDKLTLARVDEKRVYTGPKVIALVGPTGVGKTTTLAKMAFNSNFFGNKKIGLITADTYRISAVDQLKTYSNITQIPLEIIYQPEQIKKALNRFNDFDVVLVDTAGRSQRNVKQLSELKQILYEGGIVDVCLVLSMTTRSKDQDDILKRFGAINFNRLIFTKLDETSGYGSLLNASVKYNIPISILTFGQNVPDDIEYANKKKIAQMILWPEKHIFE